jgi:RNA polymerase sigma-70 factor (ECF subfamily)
MREVNRRQYNRRSSARAVMGEVDVELLGQLLDRHGPALELFARQHCETPADVVQEAFVQLIRQRKQPDNVVAWLYRVVRNGAISAGRASLRRRRHEAAAGIAQPSWFVDQENAEINPEIATSALQQLTTGQREIVVAHLWGEMTFEQIGSLVGTSASAAHRAYHAALSQLRDSLGIQCLPQKKTNTKT